MRHFLLVLITVLAAGRASSASPSAVYAATTYGPYKSTDGGVSWKQILVPPIDKSINTYPVLRMLFLDPTSSSTLYGMGTTSTFGSNILVKTTDAGGSWQSFAEPSYTTSLVRDTIAVDPVATNVFYAYSVVQHAIKSSDGGQTWTQLTIPKPPQSPGGPPNQPSLARLITDPNQTGVVYAVGPNGEEGSLGKGYLLKSADFGVTWTIVKQGLDFNSRLYIDPTNSQVMYGVNVSGFFSDCTNSFTNPGLCRMYKSTDGGQTWMGLALPRATSSLAFDAAPGVLYVSVTADVITPGILKSSDGGLSWRQVLQATSVQGYVVRTDPAIPSLVYAAVTDSDTVFRSSDGGANWTAVKLPQACDKVVFPICANAPSINDLAVAPAPPPPPGIQLVVSGASFGPDFAPNSWLTISGTDLARIAGDWSNAIVNGRLPTTLNGASVSLGGKQGYIYYTSSTQINLLAPPDVSPGPVTVTVTTPGGSASINATVSQYAPAFFAWPQNQVVATRQDFSYAVKPGTFAGATTVAAKPGEVIILWGTGFGPATPPAPSGVAVPGDQAYSTSTNPTVTINNAPALVFGAALAPGAAGLYQIAIQIPDSLVDGDWPVQASIGGATSPSGVVIAVRR